MLCSIHVAATILQQTANDKMKCIRQVQELLQHESEIDQTHSSTAAYFGAAS